MPTFERLDTPALLRCLVKLDLRSRVVVQMCFHDDATAEEIGAHLGTTAGNVRVLRHRAIAQLRQLPRSKSGGRSMSAPCATPLSFETLVAYWAGDLPQPETDAVDAHIIGCATCATRVGADRRHHRRDPGVDLAVHHPRASSTPFARAAFASRRTRCARGSARRCCFGATSTC